MIPQQLKDMKFCRVRRATKRPFEKKWQKNPYSYQEILPFVRNGENYGVMTGHNNIAILDDDTKDKKLINKAVQSFGDTFRVRDHLYFKILRWDGKKIIFHDKEGNHLGELQGLGQQAVGPGSIHPSGETYEQKNNLPIKEIDFDILIDVFKEYMPQKEEEKEKFPEEGKKTVWEGDNVLDIPITSIISIAGLDDKGKGKYQGPHPIHGSNTGMNFAVNTNSNTWYCFRHQSGGGPAEMIAVVEGIIDCSDVDKGCLSGDKGSKVIKIAWEKYGLKKPELKPDWWAEKLGINIKRFAERNNITKCPKCDVEYEFNEEKGFFRCPNCDDKGTLIKFIERFENAQQN